jgi:putative ABC transport system permease protein
VKELPGGVRRALRLSTGRGQARRDVEEELDFHFAEAVRDYMAKGLDEAEARERARARFGDERAYRYALERINEGRVRMRGRAQAWETVVGAALHAGRRIRRNAGLTASIVSILALGIGANAVMFGVVDRLLLSPPQHVVDPDGVHLLYVRREIFNGDVSVGRTLTFPDYRDFAEVDAFASVAAFTGPGRVTVGRGEDASQANVEGASASLFPLLGVQPTLGRFYTSEEDAIGGAPVAVLAHEYWERAYGKSEDVIGRTIEVGSATYDIVGVAPPGFTGAALEPVDLWVPLLVQESIESGTGWEDSRGWYWLNTVARLAPGATVEAAQTEATARHRAGREELIRQDRYDGDAEVLVAPIIAARGPRPTGEARVARWLAGVSLVVLLIACFNVANLLLARAVQTRRDTAVRLALGVSRRRLTGELVIESLVLAGLGAGVALALAYVLNTRVHQILLPDVAFTDQTLGGRLFLFTAAVAVAAGLVAGLLPAIQATEGRLADALQASRRVAGGRSRVRIALLVGQAALSVVLLVGAGLFVRSFQAASELDLGFDSRTVAVLSLKWNGAPEPSEQHAVYEEVLARVRRLPGVRAAGMTYTIPFWSSISLGQPRVPGLDSVPRHHDGGPYANKVGSGYFAAMGLTLLQGRGLEPGDDAEDAAPVAVVSESMARAIWPAGDAVGSCMVLGDADEDPPCAEVIGVVENHRRQELVEADPHFLYFLNRSHPSFRGPPQALMIGVSGDVQQMVERIRDEARGASPTIRYVDALPLRDRIEPELRSWRLGASMFSAFGVLALVVAAWGLYSVLAFDVALRRRELGIRSALGAEVSRLVAMVLRQAAVLVGAGTVIGLLVAAGAARFVAPLLFDVSATDPTVYVVVVVTLLGVAALAGSIPAARASRVDPREALQSE